mmetsp:Transcript_9682/g.33434  ORF Transcript_9682/g.33434 Transcript_9682/m.33434 type:complete len:227 (+) Transcript_9682:2414-3094(+)
MRTQIALVCLCCACARETHLCAKAEPEPVRKPRRGVVEDAGAVHPFQKVLRRFLVLGDDAVGVCAPVGVDVVHCLFHRPHYLHRHRQVAVLVTRARGGGQPQLPGRPGPSPHRHARRLQVRDRLPRQPRGNARAVEEDTLDRVAGGRIVDLGVHADRGDLGGVGLLVHVNVADAVRVSQDRNLRVLLDVGHQLVASPWDNEVDEFVQLEQVCDLVARRDQANEVAW